MTLFDEPFEPVRPRERSSVGPVTRVKMTVAYDGSPYHGFAANPGVATVAGTLQRALERVLRHPIRLTAAGRTDRGVHGWGQVVSFDAPTDGLDLVTLQRAVNKLCGATIVVRDVQIVEPTFDARFSARSRCYRYTVLNRPVPDPFMAATSWWVEHALDLRAMQLGVDPLIGAHDFTSFCRRPKDRVIGSVESDREDGHDTSPSMVRRVIDARWEDLGDGVLRFEIEATAFCHQMVRSITGTLVDVGLGRLKAGEMAGILRGRDRALAGTVAPPQGLCLWEVRY